MNTETNKPVEDWEKDFIWFLGNEALTSEVKNFIRETREQAYQKGLDDGYDEGFRACEQGVTP